MTPYITIEQADELSARVADIAAWSAATDEQKLAALLQASDEIDTLQLAGVPYGDWLAGRTGSQERAFPRFVPDEPFDWPLPRISAGGIVRDLDEDGEAIVPARVKLACLLQAMAIIREPGRLARLEDQAQNVAGQSAAGVSETYDLSRPQQVLCLQAMAQMRPYILRSGRIV